MNEASSPFTDAELQACLKVLEAIAEDRALFCQIPSDAHVRLLQAAGRISIPNRAEQRKLAKAFRKKERGEIKAADEQLKANTEIRKARAQTVFVTPTPQLKAPGHDPAEEEAIPGEAPQQHDSQGPELREARKCYICKNEYNRLHYFYDQLCPSCGDFNYQKRLQTADLRGRVALVTGGRVKIGYQAVIILLRAGAHVIVTTRFPNDAALRFRNEPDFSEWAARLEIHGLDLRLTPAVERFAAYLNQHKDRLDFILHNACQTVRRPPGFYAHLLPAEQSPLLALPQEARPLVAAYHSEQHTRRKHAIETHEHALTAKNPNALTGHPLHSQNTDDPALLTQLALIPEDHATRGRIDIFPEGELDQDLQQIDLRTHNSWRKTLAEVPTIELLEVHLVNAVAPFVLSAKLKPLMLKHKTFDKHIVNVSAMEGQFYRDYKTDKHPHTNMAKAALNMLTRTSAQDYARDGIFMNSVDTGWITDEDPAEIALKKRQIHGFHPPLDIVDGAARICDPIFSGLNTGHHAHGQFFKDYFPADW